MICPTCKASGLKSTLHSSAFGTTTLLGPTPYYDKEGQYHDHDDNSTFQETRCSNGHFLNIYRYKKCSCGWVGGVDHIVDIAGTHE